MYDIITVGNKIMGYSQAVRHQTLTLAFSLVRIQLSQPEKSTSQEVLFSTKFALRASEIASL